MVNNGNIKCVKQLLKPSDEVIKRGLSIKYDKYDTRVTQWNEIKTNYDNYTNDGCGQFLNDLDSYFRSLFDSSLLILSNSFLENDEKFDDANIFSQSEIDLIRIIEIYKIFETQSVSEIKKMLCSGDNNISEFIEVHYKCISNNIKTLLEDTNIRPTLRIFMNKQWRKYESSLEEAIQLAIKESGVQWFMNICVNGKEGIKAIYNISGGNVNLGEGLQIVDAVINRSSLGQQKGSTDILTAKIQEESVSMSIENSILNRSNIISGKDSSSSDNVKNNTGLFCSSCGVMCKSESKFCQNCGTSLR